MASMANRAIKIGPPAVLWPHLLALPLTRIITLSNSLSLYRTCARTHLHTHSQFFFLIVQSSLSLPSQQNKFGLHCFLVQLDFIFHFLAGFRHRHRSGDKPEGGGGGSVAEWSKALQSIWEISKITGS